MDWQNLLFSFDGRINRAKYWLGVLVLFVFEMIVGTILVAGFGLSLGGPTSVLPMILLLLAVIPAIWIGLALGIKRLHDRNKSAWWLILFWIVPSILTGGGTAMGDTAGLIPNLAAAALSLWGLVEIGFLRGTSGPNNYGPDPLPPET